MPDIILGSNKTVVSQTDNGNVPVLMETTLYWGFEGVKSSLSLSLYLSINLSILEGSQGSGSSAPIPLSLIRRAACLF